jgi:hypothetical protein
MVYRRVERYRVLSFGRGRSHLYAPQPAASDENLVSTSRNDRLMPLILSNEEIESIFTLENALTHSSRHCSTWKQRGREHAAPDLLVPGPLEGNYHGLKTSCASLPRAG